MKSPTTTSGKPVLDEASFQQLLSAAFVLQQHKDRQAAGSEGEGGYGKTLTAILEIQEQVRSRHLDLRAAAILVGRQVREIAGANGAAVGFLDGDQLEYYAATGTAISEAGTRVHVASAVSEDCLRSGQILQCPDAETDAHLRPDLCRPLRIKAFVGAPIFHEGRIAGVLELHFSQPGAFREHDVRTCQLLAALLAEALIKTRAEMHSAPPAEPVSAPPVAGTNGSNGRHEHAEVASGVGDAAPYTMPWPQPNLPATSPPAPERARCTNCERELDKDELFCGTCGSARPAVEAVNGRNQNTWASLWEMQRAAEKSGNGGANQAAALPRDLEDDPMDVAPSELESIVSQFSRQPAEPAQPTALSAQSFREAEPIFPQESNRPHAETNKQAESIFPEAEPERYEHPAQEPFRRQEFAPRVVRRNPADDDPLSVAPEADWTLASDTTNRKPEAATGVAGWWTAQRGNIYLGLSILLLIAVIAGWGAPDPPAMVPAPTATAGAKNRKAAPAQPELTLFEKTLVALGIAEAPEAPSDTGNPDARVWVDVHTALYYCSGADMFGKTVGGRYTTQRDAQQDAFQPASRRVCR